MKIGVSPIGELTKMSCILSSANRISKTPNPAVYLASIVASSSASFGDKRTFDVLANSFTKSPPIFVKTSLALPGSVNSVSVGLCSARYLRAESRIEYFSSINLNSGGVIW